MINIPTIAELSAQIKADLEAAYGGTIPIFGKIFLRAVIAVQAGKLKIIYLGIAFLQKNQFIDSADAEARGGNLERFGRVKLGRNPFPAVAGQYTVEVTGTPGAIIPVDTTFKGNDDSTSPGKLFILDAAKVMTGATDTITLRALGAGLGSKLVVTDNVTATAPILNIDSVGVVTVELVGAAAGEELEEYRGKGLQAFRTEPQGGAATDYRLWANDAQGVEKVYPYAKSGADGEINLFVEATIADSTDGRGTPSVGLLAAVKAVIEFDPDTTKPLNERGREPLGIIDVHYLPITPLNIDINIPGFVDLDAGTQALILASITDMASRIRPFIAAADVLADKNNILDVNRITSAILTAKPGAVFGAVSLQVAGVPVSTFTFTNGDIPYINSVTYVG